MRQRRSRPRPRACRPPAPASSVTTDLHITGKVAQFGHGIMGDVSSKLMAQFADNLNEMIDEEGIAGDAAASATEATPTTAAADASARRPPPTAPSTRWRRSQVRKIEGPATEPIDLMEVGGSSIVNRAAPAIIALILILLLVAADEADGRFAAGVAELLGTTNRRGRSLWSYTTMRATQWWCATRRSSTTARRCRPASISWARASSAT